MTKPGRSGLTKIKVWLVALLLVILPATTSIVLAQGGSEYTLFWWTVDNGGGLSQGGAFALNGTLGQPDAGTAMSGGQFSLQGGFWPAGNVSGAPPANGGQSVYLPLILR